jgi:hypothetical protein
MMRVLTCTRLRALRRRLLAVLDQVFKLCITRLNGGICDRHVWVTCEDTVSYRGRRRGGGPFLPYDTVIATGFERTQTPYLPHVQGTPGNTPLAHKRRAVERALCEGRVFRAGSMDEDRGRSRAQRFVGHDSIRSPGKQSVEWRRGRAACMSCHGTGRRHYVQRQGRHCQAQLGHLSSSSQRPGDLSDSHIVSLGDSVLEMTAYTMTL